MLSIHESVLLQLEYNDIRQWLTDKCQSIMGKTLACKLKPSPNYNSYQSQLFLLKEFKAASSDLGSFPGVPRNDIAPSAEKLKTNGAVIDLTELIAIKQSLQYLNDFDRHLHNVKSDKVYLSTERKKLNDLSIPCKAIDKILDQNNEIYANASPRLRKIRERKSELNKLIEKAFQSALKHAQNNNFLAETHESHLYGRRVLSVFVEHKRKTRGNILSYSRNGNIAYIEPESTLTLNDENDALQNEERAEIHRIMAELCKVIAPFAADFIDLSAFTAKFDLLNAKYKLSQRLDASLPKLTQNSSFQLKRAYHPTLYLKNLEEGRKTIANNISLSKEKRVMIISGPNAGGKSIALKTIGLSILMLYSGLFIPCDEESEVGNFKQIFSDIGDNQSIEDELSTYSHKLQIMSKILSTTDKNTLVLIDEFGSGSDPDLGGAIAEVFLEEVYNKGSFVALTTHYNNIKLKADKLPEAFNASMEYDMDGLKAKYRLLSGVAGQSFTFEVAKNAGFTEDLLKRAANFAGKKKMTFENSILQIEKERKALRTLQQRIKDLQTNLDKERAALAIKNKLVLKRAESESYVDLNDEKWLQLGQQTEAWLLKMPIDKKQQEKFAKKMFSALQELRKGYLTGETKVVQKKEKVVQKVKSGEMPEPVKAEKIVERPIEIGSNVRLLDSNTTGKVLEINGKKAKVQFGSLHSFIKLELLNLV